MMADFTGKVVLVTGANTIIGKATATQFAKFGASLVLVDHCSYNDLNKMAEKCAATVKPLIIVTDVKLNAEYIIDTTIQYFGRLDVLVNNSGKTSIGTLETSTLAQLNEVLQTNVQATFHITKLAVPHLVKTKGNIVSVSSVAGIRAISNYLSYCMAQSAVDQFTRCIAVELAQKGIRVNSINPGGIALKANLQTDINGIEDEVDLSGWKEHHPLGRLGNAQEVAEGIVFLANESDASFITGTILPIDGGASVLCSRR